MAQINQYTTTRVVPKSNDLYDTDMTEDGGLTYVSAKIRYQDFVNSILVKHLGNSNLVSTDATRKFMLFGDTSGDSVGFYNNAGTTHWLKVKGDGLLDAQYSRMQIGGWGSPARLSLGSTTSAKPLYVFATNSLGIDVESTSDLAITARGVNGAFSAGTGGYGIAGAGTTYGVYGYASASGGIGVFAFQNAGSYALKSTGKVNFTNLPTSSTGLSAGDVWNDAGTLKIV